MKRIEENLAFRSDGLSGMNNKNMLAAVFSSLQGLEKCLETSKKMHVSNLSDSIIVESSIREQDKILSHMRRSANKLQIQLAQENWDEIVRSLQIFYGLRQMVRPEIMATFQSLANKELKLPEIGEDASVH